MALTLSGGHADAVYSVAWSNDGTLIATGSADRTVCGWTYVPFFLHSTPHPFFLVHIAPQPTFSTQVTIWDPKAGKVLRMLKAHEETVKGMVFAPINQHNDTSVLASGGWSC